MIFILQSTQLMSYVNKTRVISLEIKISKIKIKKREEEVIVINFDIMKKI
jgi:hypothetical protein